MKEELGIGDGQICVSVHRFPIFKENRQNTYRRHFITQRVCSCRNNLPSNVVGAGTRNEFKSRLNAHFSISPLLYDHRSTWDSREGLDAPKGVARGKVV